MRQNETAWRRKQEFEERTGKGRRGGGEGVEEEDEDPELKKDKTMPGSVGKFAGTWGWSYPTTHRPIQLGAARPRRVQRAVALKGQISGSASQPLFSIVVKW